MWDRLPGIGLMRLRRPARLAEKLRKRIEDVSHLIVGRIFRALGLAFIRYGTLRELQRNLRYASRELKFFEELSFKYDVTPALRNLANSQSQLRQDLFVVTVLRALRGGYFVEFGATNGVRLSNTYLLETNYDWRGIVAEPALMWRNDLEANRDCVIDFRCVWSASGEILEFNEVQEGELSTVDCFSGNDRHAVLRKFGKKYPVETVSLVDLLRQHNAPRNIDYLSIDTEGSEFEILRGFDFDEYCFRVITVEHNFGEQRDNIYSLLTRNGYVRVYEELSLFDDWYLLNP